MILIAGGGIGGLTLALELHRLGVACTVFEQAEVYEPVGVGINILPHAARILCELGLEEALAARAVATSESAFFNRFGQTIYREPLGRAAGYAWPQFSIHRADLQEVLVAAFIARAGAERLQMGRRCVGVESDSREVTARFENGTERGSALIGCDGIHSVVRKQFYPDEGEPRYSGINMWRGVTVHEPILSGGTMIRAGWLATGKMVIYPIRRDVDARGRQLVNWVAEIETPKHLARDWNRRGRVDDFIGAFADWHFDWLDVPAMIRTAELVLEFPMVDQDPLPRWTFGRVTLLGDAAHPMVPRGSNGAGQAILDARGLAEFLARFADDVPSALQAYEDLRREATARVVLTNRSNPPDAILREVFLRTGDRPFERIEAVIPQEELVALSDGYKRITEAWL
ncbi:MAG: flavin-dependent oxidoreductase [Candidatus Eremiobacteraeota bacterium]|nr:flavin-dependent oxidoreductase [Candidatus Eremiobacteraeota bacterium]